MNNAHYSAVDNAACIAADCYAEMGAALGVLRLALNEGEATPCINAIICAEAVLEKVQRELQEIETGLHAVKREMKGAA